MKIKLKVEHRLGEVLAETVSRGRPEKGDSVSPLIPEGISKKQSSRAQQVASIPWEAIEEKIDATEGEGRDDQAGESADVCTVTPAESGFGKSLTFETRLQRFFDQDECHL